jgi:hypothetical protein
VLALGGDVSVRSIPAEYRTDISLKGELMMSEATNSGVGSEESDPATDENPPSETKAGDVARNKEGAPDTEAEAGVGGPE